MRAMRVNLEQVMTRAAYAYMIPLAEKLAEGIRGLFAAAELPWSVTQIGSRCEFQFCATPPRNGSEAEAAMNPLLEETIHLYLLNRGIIITPFHNMMLVAPDTTTSHVDRLIGTLRECIKELLAS
jgi:glutamate-1-semialdehyde 2,1-aminomutase